MWSFLASCSVPSRGNLYTLHTCSHTLPVCQPYLLIHAGQVSIHTHKFLVQDMSEEWISWG